MNYLAILTTREGRALRWERGARQAVRQGGVVDSVLATDPVFPCFAVCPCAASRP